MANFLVKLNLWDSVVSGGMNALFMPYILLIFLVLVVLFVAFLIMRHIADYIEDPLEDATEFLYNLCNKVVAPLRFLWSTLCKLTDALVACIVGLFFGKAGANGKQKERWSAFFRGFPVVLMVVAIVAALAHQAAIGRLEAFVSEGIDALPVSYFFAVVEGLFTDQKADFSLISLAEMLLCSVLSLVLMRRADEVKSTVLRYAYKLIFLVFTIVLVQYLPPQVYQWSDALWEIGATTYVYKGWTQFLLPWNAILLYLYLVILAYAAREIVATLSFSVLSLVEPEEEGAPKTKQLINDIKLMANPTMAIVLLNILLLIARFFPNLPAGLVLWVEVVGTLVCTIWYTNISTAKEAEIVEEQNEDLEERHRTRVYGARAKVQRAQLIRLRRQASQAERAGRSGATPFGHHTTVLWETVRQWNLRTCDSSCPYYRGKKKGVCTRNNAPCKQYEFCVYLERALPPSAPDVEEMRYREDFRAFITLLICVCAPIVFLAIYAVAMEWMISL